MANRHKARQSTVEILYAWSSGGRDSQAVASLLIGRHQLENRRDQDKKFLAEAVDGVVTNIESLDQAINEVIRRKDICNIASIERNILCLGVWELIFRPDIPHRVIINEALQLSRTYADENARSFVNGVLDKLARKIRGLGANASSG